MLHSMTGYGRKEAQVGTDTVIVEVRALNGKQLDINTKISSVLRPYEQQVRNKINQFLHRGSVDCSLFYNAGGSSKPIKLNMDLAKSYYQSLDQLATELNLDKNNLLATIIGMPEIISAENTVLGEDDYLKIEIILEEVLNDVVAFRKLEGTVLYQDLKNRVSNIQQLLKEISIPESDRVKKIKERIQKSLSEVKNEIKLDENRLEQEMIYYVEKIDISEEKIRLAQHCELFLEMIEKDNESGIGKKLNFILQEIGREINTIGSKANDASIQSLVVNMKDELEKAKEQSLNVL